MSTNLRSIARFATREDGAAAVIIALSLTVLMAFVALAVDVAMLYRARAELQAKADVIALSAVPDLPKADARAGATLAKNQPDAIELSDLTVGRYVRDPDLEPSERFNGYASLSNAVSVSLSTTAPIYFAQVFTNSTDVSVTVDAMATRTGAASFSLASHLAKLGNFPLSDALTQSLGLEASLSANELDLLVSSEINPRQFLEALGFDPASTSTNPAEILDRSVSPRQVIDALKTVDPTLAGALSELSLASSAPSVSVRDIVSGTDAALGLTAMGLLEDATLTAADVLSALAAPGATGSQIALNVQASVAGLLNVQTALSMGELPAESGTIALGEVGTSLHSAAARIKTDLEISPSILSSLGLGPLIEVSDIKLPIYTELAGTTAQLIELSCNGTGDALAAKFATAHTALNPANGSSVAALYLGAFPSDPMQNSSALDPSALQFADLLDITILPALPLLPSIQVTVQARAHVAVGQSSSEEITFSKAEAANSPVSKDFGSGDLAQTAASDLLNNLELRLKPNTVLNPVLTSILEALPTALLAPVDTVLDAALAAVSLKLGVGEITLKDHLCETPKLVQ